MAIWLDVWTLTFEKQRIFYFTRRKSSAATKGKIEGTTALLIETLVIVFVSVSKQASRGQASRILVEGVMPNGHQLQ